MIAMPSNGQAMIHQQPTFGSTTMATATTTTTTRIPEITGAREIISLATNDYHLNPHLCSRPLPAPQFHFNGGTDCVHDQQTQIKPLQPHLIRLTPMTMSIPITEAQSEAPTRINHLQSHPTSPCLCPANLLIFIGHNGW